MTRELSPNTSRRHFDSLYATALEAQTELQDALDRGPFDADLSLALDHLDAFLKANRAEYLASPVVYADAAERPF